MTLFDEPVLGGVLAEELGLVLVAPLTRRRDQWFEDLARRLRELEGTVEGFHFEDLSWNEQFVSATAQATQAALRTHQKEKLDALRNAVLNVAIGAKVSDGVQGVLLSVAESLQPVHVRILKQMRPGIVGISYDDAARRFISQTPGVAEFGFDGTKVLIDDLRRAGLVNVTDDGESLHSRGSGSWVSEWGLKFLAFITAPGGTNGN